MSKLKTAQFFEKMQCLGITLEDANKLRLIELCLGSWGSRECDGKIVRDETTDKPYAVYNHSDVTNKQYRVAIPDREKGALKRLDKIMVAYPHLVAYHQTDPRGCTLYLVPREKLQPGQALDAYYSSYGVAVMV
jgi:hypothetical protein